MHALTASMLLVAAATTGDADNPLGRGGAPLVAEESAGAAEPSAGAAEESAGAAEPSAVPAEHSAGAAEQFALVITNNRSLSAERADLQYADDDGAKYAELFAEVAGADHVTLLSDFDPSTRALYPEWAARSRPPTRLQLSAAVTELSQRLATLRAAGATTQVYVVFAGHGDVDRGQGFIELADTHLTARELDEEIISRLPATRIHLVLDSCNSYFMLNPRKPGGRRFATQPDVGGLLDRHPNLGAVISTSAEDVTYEWSELQSGIFSYELRSGLRGGADVDGDGAVSYAEISAYIEVANAEVANDLYRPKVFARAPAASKGALLFAAPANGRVVTVAAAGARRFTVRDGQGVRLADVNKEEGTALRLHLPRAALSFAEEVLSSERPKTRYGTIAAADAFEPEVALDTLVTEEPSIAGRGEAPVFAALFKRPFGANALAAIAARPPEAEPVVYGITRRDAENLRQHLITAARLRQDSNVQLMMVGSVFLGFASFGLIRGGMDNSLSYGDLMLIPPIGALATYAVPWKSRTGLVADLEGADMLSEARRAQAVLNVQQEFERRAARVRKIRLAAGGIGIGLGLTLGGMGAYQAWGDPASEEGDIADGITSAVYGASVVLVSIMALTVYRDPLERTWELYQATASDAVRTWDEEEVAAERGGAPSPRTTPRSTAVAPGAAGETEQSFADSLRLQLAPVTGPYGNGNGLVLGLTGTF